MTKYESEHGVTRYNATNITDYIGEHLIMHRYCKVVCLQAHVRMYEYVSLCAFLQRPEGEASDRLNWTTMTILLFT